MMFMCEVWVSCALLMHAIRAEDKKLREIAPRVHETLPLGPRNAVLRVQQMKDEAAAKAKLEADRKLRQSITVSNCCYLKVRCGQISGLSS